MCIRDRSSLDGYAAAEGWPGWWGLEGPEYLAWLGEQPEADYTALMGATTYRVMSGFAAEGEPGTDALAGMSKVVFSTTLREPLSLSLIHISAPRDQRDPAVESRARCSPPHPGQGGWLILPRWVGPRRPAPWHRDIGDRLRPIRPPSADVTSAHTHHSKSRRCQR